MTAVTLQAMSNNRFLLGVGPSGPQVVEGWHGVPYGKPLARTREYIEIVRKVFAREAPLQHEGEHYQIPYAGPGATGLGKPLKSILHGRSRIPIYTAVDHAGRAAHGGRGRRRRACRLMRPGAHRDRHRAGARRHGHGGQAARRSPTSTSPFRRIAMGKDLQACRDAVKPQLALYIGGMGARSKNFYNDYRALGYEAAAAKIQDAFLAGTPRRGHRRRARQLVDEIALVGPPERIKDRLQVWKASRQGRHDRHRCCWAARRSMRCVSSPKRFSSSRSRRGTPSASCASRPGRRSRTSPRP